MGRLGCSSARFFQAGHCVAALLHSAAGALRGDPCSCQKAKAKRDVFVVSLVEVFFFQGFNGFRALGLLFQPSNATFFPHVSCASQWFQCEARYGVCRDRSSSHRQQGAWHNFAKLMGRSLFMPVPFEVQFLLPKIKVKIRPIGLQTHVLCLHCWSLAVQGVVSGAAVTVSGPPTKTTTFSHRSVA